MNSRILIVLLACLPTVALARVGETLDEVAQRYGQSSEDTADRPTQPDTSSRLYSKNGYKIRVTFQNGVSQWEAYVRADGGAMVPGEIDALLAANATGKKWEQGASSNTTWLRDDGVLAAVAQHNGLSIINRKFLKEWEQARADKIKGF